MKKLYFLFFSCLTLTATAQTSKVAYGKIIHYENFKSHYIDARNVEIWLPPNYTAQKKHNVLYMHDGQMLFDSSFNWNHQEWQVDETAGKLLNEKKINDLIIVAIWNNGKYRRSEYFPQAPIQLLPPEIKDTLISHYLLGKTLADNYLLFLVKELKPFVDSAYATFTDVAHTFIAGSSMGGLISLYGICEYPEVFGGAACISTNWPGVVYKCESIAPKFINYLESNLPNPKNHHIYFDYGSLTLDSLYKPHQLNVDALMQAKGYTKQNWITKEFPGENHSERAWSKRLNQPLEFLLGNEN